MSPYQEAVAGKQLDYWEILTMSHSHPTHRCLFRIVVYFSYLDLFVFGTTPGQSTWEWPCQARWSMWIFSLRKLQVLIRSNVSTPLFPTKGVMVASPLSLFPRDVASYPYLGSRSLYRRRPSLDKRSLASNHCTDFTHCQIVWNIVWSYLSSLPMYTRRSSRAPGEPSI